MQSRKVFWVHDSVNNITVSYYECPSAGILIRNNFKYFEKMNPYYKEDWRIVEVGCMNESNVPVFYDTESFVFHDWSEYNYPEEVAKPLSPEEGAALRNQPSGTVGNPPPSL